MILRRLANAIREQNWFTVVIEVLVVIVGILIGLKVDDWNNERHDLAEEQIYLSRLMRDIESSLENQERQIDIALQTFNNAKTIMEVMRVGELGMMPMEEFVDLYNGTWGFTSFDLTTATMNELVSTGKITLLRSNKLREEISIFLELYENREVYYRMTSNMHVNAMQKMLSITEIEWTDDGGLVAGTSSENIIRNAEARAAWNLKTVTYSLFLHDLRALHEMTKNFHEMLKASIQERRTFE